ncbi:hypothetical protein AB0M29_18665 [Streptomyces sp. NPDC051976]
MRAAIVTGTAGQGARRATGAAGVVRRRARDRRDVEANPASYGGA